MLNTSLVATFQAFAHHLEKYTAAMYDNAFIGRYLAYKRSTGYVQYILRASNEVTRTEMLAQRSPSAHLVLAYCYRRSVRTRSPPMAAEETRQIKLTLVRTTKQCPAEINWANVSLCSI